ncbi:hypothetical protein ACJIZ3_022747 [Penstemon smallii]|uniref:Uncharacterized protein n=1 Tax=Penstemon smallii TaxID=265156 RepID=A0ABD3TNF7_9LAMI
MAIASRFSSTTFVFSNVQCNKAREDPKTSTKGGGRRELLLLSTFTSISISLVTDSQTDLLNKYLKKSQENKAKNDKERLDSYYKRNYKDYFGLLEGELKQKKELSESEKGILDWLETNK